MLNTNYDIRSRDFASFPSTVKVLVPVVDRADYYTLFTDGVIPENVGVELPKGFTFTGTDSFNPGIYAGTYEEVTFINFGETSESGIVPAAQDIEFINCTIANLKAVLTNCTMTDSPIVTSIVGGLIDSIINFTVEPAAPVHLHGRALHINLSVVDLELEIISGTDGTKEYIIDSVVTIDKDVTELKFTAGLLNTTVTAINDVAAYVIFAKPIINSTIENISLGTDNWIATGSTGNTFNNLTFEGVLTISSANTIKDTVGLGSLVLSGDGIVLDNVEGDASAKLTVGYTPASVLQELSIINSKVALTIQSAGIVKAEDSELSIANPTSAPYDLTAIGEVILTGTYTVPPTITNPENIVFSGTWNYASIPSFKALTNAILTLGTYISSELSKVFTAGNAIAAKIDVTTEIEVDKAYIDINPVLAEYTATGDLILNDLKSLDFQSITSVVDEGGIIKIKDSTPTTFDIRINSVLPLVLENVELPHDSYISNKEVTLTKVTGHLVNLISTTTGIIMLGCRVVVAAATCKFLILEDCEIRGDGTGITITNASTFDSALLFHTKFRNITFAADLDLEDADCTTADFTGCTMNRTKDEFKTEVGALNWNAVTTIWTDGLPIGEDE